MRRKNLKIIVQWDVPEEEEAVIAGFIVYAPETWGGQKHPDDPLFDSLSVKSVTIRSRKYVNPEPKEK